MHKERMRVGFVGLGNMGGRIAQRLIRAGYPVAGYNRTAERAGWLTQQGLELKPSPCEVAASVDVIFSMVTDNAALQAITEGDSGILAGLRPGQV